MNVITHGTTIMLIILGVLCYLFGAVITEMVIEDYESRRNR